MPIPVIIDTDPGIDDAIAIALAAASPELEIIGVTTVAGNTSVRNGTENALRLLHLLKRDDIPLAAGADRPLVRTDSQPDVTTHGTTGFGGVELPPAPRTADSRGAVALATELLERAAAPVTIIPIGPLTNIATLLRERPEVRRKIGRIVLMGGGARVIGNMTPAAEFNIWFDPEAAAEVFASGIPITMVGLDATHRALTKPSDWEPLRGGSALATFILGIVDFYAEYHRAAMGTSETAQHDSLAVAAVIDPTLVETELLHVDVECAGQLTKGMTVVDVDRVGRRPPNADVALGVDRDRFTRELVSRLARLDARLRSGEGGVARGN